MTAGKSYGRFDVLIAVFLRIQHWTIISPKFVLKFWKISKHQLKKKKKVEHILDIYYFFIHSISVQYNRLMLITAPGFTCRRMKKLSFSRFLKAYLNHGWNSLQ